MYELTGTVRNRWLLLTLACTAILAGCAGGPPTGPTELTIVVDPALDPGTPEELPHLGDGQPRPLAALSVDGSEPADFVANELWLATDDAEALAAFLDRWDGTVLLSVTRSEYDIAELPDQYLVRLAPPATSADELAEILRALSPATGGQLRVSSDAALRLLSAGSSEAAAGLAVGLNWVGAGTALRDRSATEAPTGEDLGSDPYSPNPFTWSTHTVGREQNIGVGEAWRALDLAGRLGNRVKLAILDMGFAPNADMPAGWTAWSIVPTYQPTGTANLLNCGASACPWHGTNVASAAMAVVDNGYGAAGPAGPIAEPLLIYTSYDYFSAMVAVALARANGAKIVNMSFSTRVPWYLAWSVYPFDAATVALRASGMLMFAAAGNKGENVDADCGEFYCGEAAWHTPCENSGVICVGGIGVDSVNRASNSNYGTEHVDIFGPYNLLIGPDPSAPDNRARTRSGTSLSSPFVAGVAALVWAAEPSLSASDVERILMDTAHPGVSSVKRIVNALGAVSAALGNLPPTFEMPPSSTLMLKVPSELSVSVTDLEDAFPCCTVTWVSDVDGQLGSGWSVSHVFSTVGPRTITVTATDSAGATSSQSKLFTVVNEAPLALITAPRPGAELLRGVPAVLRGQASDRNETGEILDCQYLVWTSSVASDPFPVTGCNLQANFPTNGDRTLTLTATDPEGAADTRTVFVTVVDPPANIPPVVNITSPTHHQAAPFDMPINLVASAVDPEGDTDLTYRWTVQLFDETPIEVGTAASAAFTPTALWNFGAAGRYTVRVLLTVTDSDGAAGSDEVELQWDVIL